MIKSTGSKPRRALRKNATSKLARRANAKGKASAASISEACGQIAELLARSGRRVVLAESCTAGLAAASLGELPGISKYFCGSAVTYRDATKEAWLRIPREILNDRGAVSAAVARMMAQHTLAITPEAHFAASVTGHVGPGAPARLDGTIFVGIAERQPEEMATTVKQFRLASRSRVARQREAAIHLLVMLRKALAKGVS